MRATTTIVIFICTHILPIAVRQLLNWYRAVTTVHRKLLCISVHWYRVFVTSGNCSSGRISWRPLLHLLQEHIHDLPHARVYNHVPTSLYHAAQVSDLQLTLLWPVSFIIVGPISKQSIMMYRFEANVNVTISTAAKQILYILTPSFYDIYNLLYVFFHFSVFM